MPISRYVHLVLFGFSSTTVVASAASREVDTHSSVVLMSSVERISSSSAPLSLTGIVQSLAEIDSANPTIDGSSSQTLSIFGREDLIASGVRDFLPTECTAVIGSDDPLDEIARRAGSTSIVIVNESHSRSRHRGFIERVAMRLRSLGYDTLADETLSNPLSDAPAGSLPPFITQPTLPYFSDADGYYLREASFGRIGRRVKYLGYTLLPYDFIPQAHGMNTLNGEQIIAAREEGEAEALASYLRKHPGGKILIHVGYAHAAEVPQSDGLRLMALRLKEKTGIDPLTISQTTCRGGGLTEHLAVLPSKLPRGMFDLVVDHPTEKFVRGRPAWRINAGDIATTIPPDLQPISGWRIIEARPIGEPTTSVPLDRVAIRRGEDVALMLPPGRYQIRAIDVPSPSKTARLGS